MFNLSRYNLAGFNLPSEQKTIRYAAAMYATTQAMVSNGGDEYLQESMASALRAGLSAGPAEEVKENWAANVLVEAILSPSILLQTKMSIKLWGAAAAGLDLYLREEQESEMGSQADLGCDLLFRLLEEAQVQGSMEIGCDICIKKTMGSFLNVQVSSYIVEEQFAFLDVTIPPGGTLIIDSQNYNVLLNGKSMIWAHSGDWVWVSRETMLLSVRAAAGSRLENKILYTERFL